MRGCVVVFTILLGFAAVSPPDAGPQSVLILYDNTTTRPELQPDWGFAAQVKYRGHRILFDAGTTPDVLAGNMKQLAAEAAAFELAVFTHPHQDHLGGLPAALRLRPALPVYFLDSFPAAVSASAHSMGAKPVIVAASRQITPGIYTTGPVEGEPSEQAVVIDTPRGLAVLVGCSHPGIVKMVEAARRTRPGVPIRLVAGGFHMLRDSEAQVRTAVARLREIGVQSIMPTHCTGAAATAIFRQEYGNGCVRGGVGTSIPLD